MAADQRKKRVNASLIACTSRAQYRVKRKKFQVQHHNLYVRPIISLEWDNNKKTVVSKRDQIAIAQRHLIPCIEPNPHGTSILGDVISVPQEIFDLEHLKDILSYEVWQGLLSDMERDFLSQFLPKELEPDAILRDLFAGDNFHFGNPFLKWGASLCIGKLHPDNVLLEGQHLKTAKKDYYAHLQKFHNDMIENLQMCKNKWVSCKDPGVDTVPNIWSSRKHTRQSIPLPETGFYASEENLITTPESCSWINSEVAYSSDNQILGMKQEESQRRKDSSKISNSSNETRGTAVPRKGENICKRNIQDADGAKYMSYVKVSREQHERVKSCMKHAGSSILPKSLNNVIGNIDTLNVQPFERFEEEERKKLHNHWLKLARKDIAEGFANWERRQFQRQELKWFLGKELGQKLQQQLVSRDWEKHDFRHKRRRFSDGIDQEILPSTANEGVDTDPTDEFLPLQSYKEEAIPDMPTEKDEKEIDNENIFEHRIHDNTEIIEDDNVPRHVLVQDHNELQTASHSNNPRSTMSTPPSPSSLQDLGHPRRISSLDCNLHRNSLEIDPNCGNACAKTNGDCSIESQYPENLNHEDVSVNQRDLLPSSCDVWPVAEVNGSYYQSDAANAGYRSSPESSISRAQFLQGQDLGMLDLENDGQGKDAGNEVMHRPTEDISYFSSYSNQDRNELLQSLFKGQSNMPYHQQQKHSDLEFQPGNNLMEAGQFSEIREQIHLSQQLDTRQKRLNDLFMNQKIQENIYPGGHYAMPRQEELPVNIHGWTSTSKACMPVSSQPHMSGGEPSQGWCGGENGIRDGWPSFGIAVGVSHSLGSGSNSDQTLFSVISEYNELQPRSSYESACTTERLMLAGNYNGIGGGIPTSSNFLQQSPNRLNYLSGLEASGAMKMNNLGWIGMPQQSSGMQESMGKPFLRSWNQQG